VRPRSATLAASAFLFPAEIFNAPPLLDKIGIQFFSVPKSLDTDLAGTLTMLSKIGYKQVELYGPYPFSNEAGKKSWAAVAPSLGFSGSGFFGHSVTEFKKMLDDNGFTAPSMHTDLDTLEQNMPQLAEAARRHRRTRSAHSRANPARHRERARRQRVALLQRPEEGAERH